MDNGYCGIGRKILYPTKEPNKFVSAIVWVDLPWNHKVYKIFTTNSSEIASEAHKIDQLRYLLDNMSITCFGMWECSVHIWTQPTEITK